MPGSSRPRGLLGLSLLVSLTPLALAAQTPAAGSGASLATVSGVVWDSIGKAPLSGAFVEMAGAADSAGRRFAAVSDSLGRFRVDGMPAGTYAVAFNHSIVDSLGFQMTTRVVTLRPGPQRVDLGTPSQETIARSICGARAGADSTGLLIGHVRAAESELPIPNAWVVVRWVETMFDTKGVRQQERALSATSVPSGWFGICGVPSDVSVLARAGSGPDSSGYVPVEVPTGGLRHLNVFIGRTVRIPVEVLDTAERTAGITAMMAWRGRARLSGTVRDDRGEPIANARVLVIGTGMETMTGTRGTFALDSLPAGTQTVDVRAIGFVPVQRMVNLAERSPTTMDLPLGERAEVLSTVRVRGTPVYSKLFAPKLAGFFERMRDKNIGIGRGTFITPQDMERRQAPNIINMLEGIPSLNVRHGDRPGDDVLLGRAQCQMTVFLDGVRVIGKRTNVREESLNTIVNPRNVVAMEVYADAFDAPPQYQPSDQKCGVVLVWTR